MDFTFTPEQDALREQAREFLAATREPTWAQLAELGWTGVSVAEEDGGAGLTFVEEAVLFEELGLVRHTHLSDRAPTYHSVTDHEHFHLVCRNCGRVASVAPDVLTPLAERLRDEENFVVDVGHLTVFGRCVVCPPPAAGETS